MPLSTARQVWKTMSKFESLRVMSDVTSLPCKTDGRTNSRTNTTHYIQISIWYSYGSKMEKRRASFMQVGYDLWPTGPASVFVRGQPSGESWEVGGLLACWLLNVQATCVCISGTELLRQLYVLPHWEKKSHRSHFLSHPVTVYWHRADQS